MGERSLIKRLVQQNGMNRLNAKTIHTFLIFIYEFTNANSFCPTTRKLKDKLS